MIDDDKDLDDLLGSLARADGRRDPDDHPTPASLAAYRENRLSAEEDEEVREHLAICRECSVLLLGFEDFVEKPAETGVADFETAADWRKLRARLDEDAWFEKGGKASRSWRRTNLALVAAVLIALVGVSLYTFWSPGSSVQTLEPLNSRRNGDGKVEVVRLPVTLLLRPPRTSFPEYRAELRDEAGRVVDTFPGLQENASFDLEVPLRRWSLPSGQYRIDLLGLQDKRFVPAGEYAFRVADR